MLNIKEKLMALLQQKRDIVILPMGEWGKNVKKILNEELNATEAFCIDNHNYDLEKIFPINKMPYIENNLMFVISVIDDDLRYQIYRELIKYVREEQIIDIFEHNLAEDKICAQENKVQLDFLCVGFQKCGTTSLHSALLQNEKVYLPPLKETFFARNIDDRAHNLLKQSYPSEKVQDRIVGGIEPSYFDRSRQIYKYFGENLKIIFCMDDPVKALQSAFRMCMRNAEGINLEYIKAHNGVTLEFFEKWAEGWLTNFKYVNYIKEFLKYYDKEQLKFLVSDELYKDTKNVMNDLQKFIGLTKEQCVQYPEFPHSNKGKRVSKNVAAACVNERIHELWFCEEDIECRLGLWKLKNSVFDITTEVFEEKLSKEPLKKYQEYYRESVLDLEELLGKKLVEKWWLVNE